MPRPYPGEFREDVIRVACERDADVWLKGIAADFGIWESCLNAWLKAADVEDGIMPGTTAAENARSCAPRGGASGCSRGERGAATSGGVSVAREPAGKMMYPLVRDLAVDGIPVTVTCRVLKIPRQPHCRWLAYPVSDREGRGASGERGLRRASRRPRVRVSVPRG